ncbi:cell wall hydrolase [Brucella pseudogrignonensis]|uniref:Spore germination cell wall hydrolase CwlJ-like protein n=1 Tax=Brucella pseudogrignonensis TaxID=419475 RepID=A0ABU1M9M4_9HYPH|nr:cell wall hydrolase [Brucella pseudogrignonensis]MDR6432729.1 spore germination cell wall hydrolase CwlJ-like protein [Brucella pseudogrignonensis]
MTRARKWKLPVILGLFVAPFLVTGCTTTGGTSKTKTEKTAAVSHVKSVNGVKTFTYTARDRECLERAMFFESNRSSSDGLMAVGTVVMNRLASGSYPDTICGVVGQKNQFAPGVLTRKMNSKALPDVQAAADAVLKGKRHPSLKNSMFFHTAGLKFPYNNMHYVLVAGGNSFYEKRGRDGELQNPVPQTPYNLAYVSTPQSPSMPDGPFYNVTTQQDGTVPEAQPTVQVALAEAAKTAETQQNGGVGPQARGDRLATLPVTPAEKPVLTQVASYQPTFDETAPAEQNASLAYTADKKHVDAIGAMLLAQDRPQSPL